MSSDIISNVNIYGLNESIVASGYPMLKSSLTHEQFIIACENVVADEDSKHLTRAKKLANTGIGEGHDNYLNGIIVQFDLLFTVKAWTEAERYRFLEFVSSQSTMHRIARFDIENSYVPYVDSRMITIMRELVDTYNRTQSQEDYLKLLYSNPCGFRLTARMTTNYRCLANIYKQRKNHRLPEWKAFCKWIETLPYAKELIILESEDNT